MANWCFKCARKPYIGCDASCPIFGKYLEEVAEDYFKLQGDAVVVVRCKECKHWWKDAKLCVHPKCCEGCVAVVDAPPTHYCGYGERKENANS